jgi:hypothetical protein
MAMVVNLAPSHGDTGKDQDATVQGNIAAERDVCGMARGRGAEGCA